MENNDPYEELEIYLKQINVSKQTIDLPLLHAHRQKKFLSLFHHRFFLLPIDRLFWSDCESKSQAAHNAKDATQSIAKQKLISATEWIQFHSWSDAANFFMAFLLRFFHFLF